MQKLWLSFILFHFGSFKYFKHYYKEYVCNHLIHLFSTACTIIALRVGKGNMLPLSSFIKEVLLGTYTSIGFVDLAFFVFVVINRYIELAFKGLRY